MGLISMKLQCICMLCCWGLFGVIIKPYRASILRLVSKPGLQGHCIISVIQLIVKDIQLHISFFGICTCSGSHQFKKLLSTANDDVDDDDDDDDSYNE